MVDKVPKHWKFLLFFYFVKAGFGQGLRGRCIQLCQHFSFKGQTVRFILHCLEIPYSSLFNLGKKFVDNHNTPEGKNLVTLSLLSVENDFFVQQYLSLEF